MDDRITRDSAFVEDDASETAEEKTDDTAVDLLEQQQAREQTRLLQRFRELRQWQQQQQEQLMQQQQQQLEMLKGEQLRVQTLIASQRGAQWGEGRVSRPEVMRKSPPLMTPPRRAGVGGELAKAVMSLPMASADSGLVASMGDTLEQPKDSLPKPVMYATSPSLDEDKYTNPELFSNPGSHGDDLQALDDQFQCFDNGSEVGSDNFYLPPLPPEPKESQGDMGSSLKTLQALMATTAPDFLQQMLGLLPAQQKSLLLEQRQAAVQESASPTFSPVHPAAVHQSVPSAPSKPFAPSLFARSLGAQPLGGALWPQSQNLPRPQGPAGSSLQAQFHRPSLELGSQTDGFVPSKDQGHRQISQEQSCAQALSQSQPHFRHADTWQHQDLDQQEQRQFFHQQHQRLEHLLRGQHQHGDQRQFYHQQQQPQCVDFQLQQQSQHYDLQQQQFSHRHQQHQHFDHQLQQQQVRHQQQLCQQLSQEPAHRQSQSHPLPKHVPLEPQVRARLSWEEERDEEETARLSSSQDREEGEEEEEEEEELEVTVKQVVSSPEDRPIRPGLQGRKTFEQLLDEQLADEEKRVEEERRREEANRQPSGPVKRPFLRKGQGIARFSQPIKRPPPKRSSGGGGHKAESSRSAAASRSSSGVNSDLERTASQAKPPAKRQPEKKRLSVGKKKMEDEDPPQPEKLKLIKRKSETGKKAQAASRPVNSAGQNKQMAGNSAHNEDQEERDSIADDDSFVAGLTEREKAAPLEAEELDEFEALEDIADNMSLVSNSSVVQRLITPNKQRQKTAVSDLKTVLEKKRNAPSSPFERNAAIRSLLSINIPCPPASSSPELKEKSEERPDDKDDTLIEDDTDVEGDLEVEGGKEIPETGSRGREGDGVPVVLGHRNCEDSEFGAMKTRFSDSDAVRQGQTLNGLEFSNQFHLFDQHRHSSHDPVGAGDAPPSPTKSLTRKVATLQSRLSAANDTAALLQKLSAHAGFLSSGVPRAEAGETSVRTNQVIDDESGHDSSLLSHSVSRPQPLVIGGKREDEHSGNFFAADSHSAVRTGSDEESDNDTIEENDDDDDDSVSEEEKDFGEKDGQTQESSLPSNSIGNSGHATSNSNNNNDNNNSDKFDFGDEEEWTSSAPQVSSSQLPDVGGRAAETTPPTSKLMSRLFPKLKPKPTAVQQQQLEKMQMASSTSVGDGIQSKILREKLAELEAEIEKFRTENATLEKLRREREEGVNKLKEEIARFEQEKTDELRRLEEFKAQETKKLKHERKLFETYQKQVRSMPDKKDREEIESLRRQLSDLQEEMKRKESRWTSSVTRLKTRIAELEGQNAEMREEMKMLERRRLEWMQTRATNKPAQSQQTSTTRSAPRSSTPTNSSGTFISNGVHDVASAVNGSQFKAPPSLSLPSGAVSVTTHMNGTGAAGKTSGGSGGHSGSGGESVPRGQPATPSMIEGMSPAAMADGGEGSMSFLMTPPVTSRPAVDRPTVDKGNGQYEETQYSDGKVERVYSNGSREVLFANGTRKEISSDGQYFIVSFFNGDIKQVFPDQRVVYYYAESQTTHTTYPDRLEVLQFPNNQIEKHYPDGTHEITFPNQTVKYLFPNGTEESIFPDGTILRIDKNGEKILEFPNGQREIHTQEHKRREYPDGTVKTLHNDGRQETRYATGRIRLKDKDGNVLLDRMY